MVDVIAVLFPGLCECVCVKSCGLDDMGGRDRVCVRWRGGCWSFHVRGTGDGMGNDDSQTTRGMCQCVLATGELPFRARLADVSR